MALPEQVRLWRAKARAWSLPERLCAVTCALVVLGLLVWALRLWPEWRINPDLSHGFFALPVVFLLWRRAAEDAAAGPGLARGAQVLLFVPAGLLALAASLLSTVYAVAMGWDSVPTLFYLSVVAAAAAVIAATLAAGDRPRWIRPGWVLLVIPAVIVLSAPLPPATYARLTITLQEFITAGVVETLRLFGVPAMRAGNVIHLGNTSVGVEEACSGVRSLISCVLAGLILSALMLRSPGRRAVLLLVAGPLALLTNFFRSLALTLLARNGVDIAGAWHDGLGFAVLGVTTALLAWLASTLEDGDRATPQLEATPRPASAFAGMAGLGAASAGVLLFTALWLGFVASRTERQAGQSGPVADLSRLVPERAPEAWTVRTRTDLFYYFGALRTDHLLERTYERRGPEGLTQITVYVAWWPAGQSSVSRVAAHTPESCWPGSGWSMDGSRSARLSLPLPDGGQVEEAEQRFFWQGTFPQRVWFWHLVGKEPFRAFNPLSWREQLALFFEHGVRRDEPQAFVRLSTNREWSEIAGDPLVAEILKGLAELGVPVVRPGAGQEAPAGAGTGDLGGRTENALR